MLRSCVIHHALGSCSMHQKEIAESICGSLTTFAKKTNSYHQS